MKLGAFLMPSHPPERSLRDGQQCDLDDLERLDELGFEEACGKPKITVQSQGWDLGLNVKPLPSAAAPHPLRTQRV